MGMQSPKSSHFIREMVTFGFDSVIHRKSDLDGWVHFLKRNRILAPCPGLGCISRYVGLDICIVILVPLSSLVGTNRINIHGYYIPSLFLSCVYICVCVCVGWMALHG